MSWRTVVVSSSAKLDYQMGYLVVRKDTKSVEIVFSPVLIDMNTKRIQTHLFNEMKEVSNEFCYELKEKVNNIIVSYLDELSSKLAYPVSFNLNLDETGLYKQYEVRVDFESNDLTDKVINYIQLQALLCNVKVIVFVNGKAYFSEEQLREIYTCAFYNKIYILIVESGKRIVCRMKNII